MDPQEYVRNYTYLLGEGKKAGLEGNALSGFIGTGLSGIKPAKSETAELFAGLKDIQAIYNDPVLRKQILEDTLGFQKEQMKEAGKYKMLFDIPQGISQAFGNQAMLNLLGARSATEALATTLANYPRAQFTSYQFQPQSYLS